MSPRNATGPLLKTAARNSRIRVVQPQPDIIILPELENPAILTRLNTEFLSGLGYTVEVELNSTVVDLDRGIDVGILSNCLWPVRLARTRSTSETTKMTAAQRATSQKLLFSCLTGRHSTCLRCISVWRQPLRCREHAMRALNGVSKFVVIGPLWFEQFIRRSLRLPHRRAPGEDIRTSVLIARN